MIPLCLVTGFLGSGKTTFLRQAISRNRKRRLVCIVNEISQVDIDSERLQLPEGRLIEVAGGSIFCRCKATEFIKVMRAAAEENKPEGALIEASGTADPTVLGQMLDDSKLNRLYTVASIVAIIDPGSFLKLSSMLPSIEAQARAATIIQINKSDLYSAEKLAKTEQTLRNLNPSAKISRTKHCQARVAIFGPGKEMPPQGRYAPCADPNFCALTVKPSPNLSLAALRAEINGAAGCLYRVKGRAIFEERWLSLDWANGVWTIEPAAARSAPVLVLIGRGQARERLEELRRRLRERF